MTFRLVALMSIVLLLSLATFGLLVNHYQQRFMEEVAHTASVVGRAALSTVEQANLRVAAPGGEGSWVAKPPGSGPRPAGGAAEESDETHRGKDAVVQHSGDGERAATPNSGVRHVVTTSTDDGLFTVTEQTVYPADAFPSDLGTEDMGRRLRACLGAGDVAAVGAEAEARVFINVQAITAESDPSSGLVLKIPRFTPATGEDDAGVIHYEFDMAEETSDPKDNVFFLRRDDIRLPIPLDDYRTLFARMRKRSMALFLGVVGVGMVLSTGLATRFTRPIRKLDAGIRRLSTGDLDVTVDARGQDEIGRLARAFNEMAGRLRVMRDRERDMVRRDRLTALGRLAAGVAHDVRNPLHSIGLTLQHLRETARPTEEERAGEFDRSLEIIRGEIRRLDQLVTNFLGFARSEPGPLEPIDLAEVTRETVRLVEQEAERRGVRLELKLDQAVPLAAADGQGLRSSILNLILNSFEAMPDGGTLTLTLSSRAGEALLQVADTGRGIPREEQEHVFDFAYTTREGGHGMGLAMVHHCVVEQHGGRVSLESRPDEGTCVSLVLPLAAEGKG